MEGPRAAGGAAAIHHDGDETEFSDLLLAIAERRAESFRNEEALRAGVNLFDDGIFLGKIEIRRLPDEAVEISRAVLGFAAKGFRSFPASLGEFADIGLLKSADLRAVFGALQHRNRRQVGPGKVVDEVSSIGRKVHCVRGIFRCEQRESFAIETDDVEMRLIRVFVFFAAVGKKIDAAGFFVHVDNLPNNPRPLRQLAAQFTGFET